MRRILVFIVSVTLVMVMNGCSKETTNGSMPEGMIALSFDDAYVDNWYNHLSFLDSLGIKATFYISGYHNLRINQINKLRSFPSHGHEIGYHTTNHADLAKLSARSGMKAVFDTEIKPDLALMRGDGFDPVNFAYPFGQHDYNLDREMLRVFKSVRGVSNKKNYNTCLAKQSGSGQVFYAPSIDARSKITDEDIQRLVQAAHDNHTCVLFYAHGLGDPANNIQVTETRLRYLYSLARQYNLRFVTVSEISQ